MIDRIERGIVYALKPASRHDTVTNDVLGCRRKDAQTEIYAGGLLQCPLHRAIKHRRRRRSFRDYAQRKGRTDNYEIES